MRMARFLDFATDELQGDSRPPAVALLAEFRARILNYRKSWTPRQVRDLIKQYITDPTESQAAIAIFDEKLQQFQALESSGRLSKTQSLLSAGAGFCIILLIGGLIWVVYTFISNSESLATLGDPDIARGLITFVVTIGTIGIAFTLIGGLFVVSSDGLKERFDAGGQILTALIAVLGTIVGFYYGTTVRNGILPTLTPPTISPKEVAAGGSFDLGAMISGGKPPFDYLITVRAEGVEEPLLVRDGTTSTGAVLEHFELGDRVTGGDKPVPLIVAVKATDANNLSVAAEPVTVAVTAPAAAAAGGAGTTASNTTNASTTTEPPETQTEPPAAETEVPAEQTGAQAGATSEAASEPATTPQ